MMILHKLAQAIHPVLTIVNHGDGQPYYLTSCTALGDFQPPSWSKAVDLSDPDWMQPFLEPNYQLALNQLHAIHERIRTALASSPHEMRVLHLRLLKGKVITTETHVEGEHRFVITKNNTRKSLGRHGIDAYTLEAQIGHKHSVYGYVGTSTPTVDVVTLEEWVQHILGSNCSSNI